jgi:hypothetical protein
MKKVMRRKPSASHWVQNVPRETKSPSSRVFSAGRQPVSMSTVARRSIGGRVRPRSSAVYPPAASRRPSIATAWSSRSSPSSTSGTGSPRRAT